MVNKCCRSTGHPEFTDTAEFLKIVRKMWNITNARTLKIRQKNMDDSRQAIHKPADKNLLYFLEFAAWGK